jgi:hypothetical protein
MHQPDADAGGSDAPPPAETEPAADIDPYNFTARGSKPAKSRRSSSDDEGDKKGRFRLRR